ncbi:RNA-binding S4 domain-containing protein [Thalassotalea sp. Y01]|uniref:RNA-binding S4 domain-containing protein n=1 Tax=Thalassotalea sp. Y01 TaxID=2729613 RepID=UPI00145EF90E|nr:RNA-binding S4 domain-containing protein [Thalassotalea sp. Y01]
MEIEVLAIEINQEPIELYKLLKIANLVGGGGEAKMMISEGYVFLNGEVEYQKRKKVYFEDIVQFNGEAVMPILNPNYVAPEPTIAVVSAKKPAKQNKPSKQEKTNKAKKQPSTGRRKNPQKQKGSDNKAEPDTHSRTGRKSISF